MYFKNKAESSKAVSVFWNPCLAPEERPYGEQTALIRKLQVRQRLNVWSQYTILMPQREGNGADSFKK